MCFSKSFTLQFMFASNITAEQLLASRLTKFDLLFTRCCACLNNIPDLTIRFFQFSTSLMNGKSVSAFQALYLRRDTFTRWTCVYCDFHRRNFWMSTFRFVNEHSSFIILVYLQLTHVWDFRTNTSSIVVFCTDAWLCRWSVRFALTWLHSCQSVSALRI